jgi:hypothetical protein
MRSLRSSRANNRADITLFLKGGVVIGGLDFDLLELMTWVKERNRRDVAAAFVLPLDTHVGEEVERPTVASLARSSLKLEKKSMGLMYWRYT